MNIDPLTDSLSYWHETAEPMIPADEQPTSAEVVVIGAGMLGCWTAYWLAKSGVSVVVLEQSAIGWGATGRNGGFLVGGGAIGYNRMIDHLGPDKAKKLYSLTIAGQELAHHVINEEEIDCDLRRTGALTLALSQQALEGMKAQQSRLLQDSFETTILTRNEVQALIETPLAEEVVGGWLAASGGLLHSSRYLSGLARAAEKYGARFVQATVQLVHSSSDGAVIDTSVGTIEAGRVVIALNAWTDLLVREMHGVIVPTRGQIIAYKPMSPIFRTAIGTDITPTGEYWQQTPDGTIIIGGCRADALNGDANVRQMVTTPEVAAKIEQVLPRLFPELGSLEVDRRWAGLMAFTKDGMPIVDHMEGSNAVWYAGGFCGHGMPFGPMLGKMLAATITDSSVSDELRILSRSRTSLEPNATM